MNKIPRFMKEYAEYQKMKIAKNEFIDEDTKNQAIKDADKILQIYERGLITITEAMQMLMNCL